jgi:hypothetical protein
MKEVETNHGPIMVGKPNEFTSMNERTGGYVPGRTLLIKGSKLHESGDYVVTPYVEKVELLKRSATLALVSINNRSWYVFPINRNEEGKEFITTSKNFRKGFNDSETAVSEAFQKQVEDYEKKQYQAEVAAIAQKETDRLNAESAARKTEVKTRMLEVQFQIQKLSSNRRADDIIKDSFLQTMLSEYVRLECLLKIRAL